MTEIVHINCGTIRVEGYPTVVCHCLALRDGEATVLVDSGIGLLDVQDPEGRLGAELIAQAGFCFNRNDTAASRLEAMGVDRGSVSDIILTHADPDHTGGLADFPVARVHISQQEKANLGSENPRYVRTHFEHSPVWIEHRADAPGTDWFGFTARKLDLPISADVLLIPLPGHTLGHCGVAVGIGDRWLLHVGDAYYLEAELADKDHPVDGLASLRADDDTSRRASLEALRRLKTDHNDQIRMIGYHDITELPEHCIDWEE